MYSVVTFKNYKPEGAENYGTVLWYTDPEFNTPLEYTGSGAGATYSQLMTENLSLYAYYNYIIMFHDSDGTGVFKQTIPPQQDTVPLPAFGYDMNDKHKGHIFLGWAVIPTTGDNAGKRVLTYVPEESIPIGDFDGTTKRMDLYAYYYTDGTFVKTYNGATQYASIANDDTGEGGQVNIPAANITIQYSTDNENWRSQIGLEHVNSMNGYYKVNITTPKHSTAYEATGSFTMTIVPLSVYVIAPTANKAYDGTSLVVTTENVRVLAINGVLPGDTFTFKLKTNEGYSDTQSGIGFSRTRAEIDGPVSNDYRAYYIEGVIAVYDDDSAKYESRGYTYVS